MSQLILMNVWLALLLKYSIPAARHLLWKLKLWSVCLFVSLEISVTESWSFCRSTASFWCLLFWFWSVAACCWKLLMLLQKQCFSFTSINVGSLLICFSFNASGRNSKSTELFLPWCASIWVLSLWCKVVVIFVFFVRLFKKIHSYSLDNLPQPTVGWETVLIKRGIFHSVMSVFLRLQCFYAVFWISLWLSKCCFPFYIMLPK